MLLQKSLQALGIFLILILTITCSTKRIKNTTKLYLLKTDKTTFLSNPGFSSNGKIKIANYKIGDSLKLYNDMNCNGLDIGTITPVANETYFDVTFVDGNNYYSIQKTSLNGDTSCISHVSYTKSYFDLDLNLTSEDGYLNATWDYPKFTSTGTVNFRLNVLPGSIDISSNLTSHTFNDLALSTYKVTVSAIDNDGSIISISNFKKLNTSHDRPILQLIGGDPITPRINENNYVDMLSSSMNYKATIFAILRRDGTIYYWNADATPNIQQLPGSDYNAAVTISSSIAALQKNGTIYQKGYYGTGLISGSNYKTINSLGDPTASFKDSFAALKKDGTIFSWGFPSHGGIGNVAGSNYVELVTNGGAYAALKEDGTIFSWGLSNAGGIGDIPGSEYVTVFANNMDFTAFRGDGSIYSWGRGIMNNTTTVIPGAEYTAIAGTINAFAVLRKNGTVYAWGDSNQGGIGDVSGSNYVSIASNNGAFAALKKDGTIFSWGRYTDGGIGDIPGNGYISITGMSKYTDNTGAFAALKEDGTIYMWGSFSKTIPGSGYVAIAGAYGRFAALRNDGSVYMWGSDINYEVPIPTLP